MKKKEKKKLCWKQWKGRAKITLSKWCPYSKGNFRRSTSVKGHPSGAPLSPGARGFAHPEPIGVTPLTVSPILTRKRQRKYTRHTHTNEMVINAEETSLQQYH